MTTIEIIAMVLLKVVLTLMCSGLATMTAAVGVLSFKEDLPLCGIASFALTLVSIALIPVIILVM